MLRSVTRIIPDCLQITCACLMMTCTSCTCLETLRDSSCQEACAATVHARASSSSSSSSSSNSMQAWYGVCRPSWTHLMRGPERSAPNGMTGAMWKRGEPPSLPKHCHDRSSFDHSGSLQYTYIKNRKAKASPLRIITGA